MMKKIFRFFKINKDERIEAIIALVVIFSLNLLMIYKYFKLFTRTDKGFWNVFVNNFHISGFDPVTYNVISHWMTNYNVYRHPLLAFMMYPLSLLDDWLVSLTGMNLVQFVILIPIVFCAFYSFIFINRIFRLVIGLKRIDGVLLSAMFYSFAYIMTTIIVPDHFVYSMFFLTLIIYVAGLKMKNKTYFTKWQTVILFIFMAGITLSNGIKTFIYVLFTNGKRFFRPANLIFVVVLPAGLMWAFCQYEYKTYVWSQDHEQKLKKVAQAKKDQQKIFKLYADTSSITDSSLIAAASRKIYIAQIRAIHQKNMKDPWNANQGKSIGKSGFMKWTDVSTSRTQSMIENLFGESIQFHQQHFLEDVLKERPVIVRYDWAVNYIVEAVIILLFIVGILYGSRSKFLWMCLSGAAFDMILHLGLGFGLNEVYIMSAHWIFVIPIAIAYLMKSLKGKNLIALRAFITVITAYLWIYNGTLLIHYLLMQATA